MSRYLVFLFTLLCHVSANASFVWAAGEQMAITVANGEASVVHMAVELLQRDARAVLGSDLKPDAIGHIVVRTQPETFPVGSHEAFRLTVREGQLLIQGSDAHGTAYGVIEITRLLGVSPWEWWADVAPLPKTELCLEDTCYTASPSVAYRGIFINDEDWGILPWSDGMGPDVYDRIFALMLRLRANTLWPAMHERTPPFFLTPGNRELAAAYGIYVGGSHCEPMACNAAGEWPVRGIGEYDYVNNDTAVRRFWEDRVREVAGQDILYTIGMRGVHDGAMQGAKTVDEQRQVLERVFRDQRELLARYINPDVTKVPQVFIPYKEVLDVYNAGLSVPDDVCLMWCDDNYGYISHFPDATERNRKGGNGIYYHVSYWGRPHDYLWLGTASPALLYQQLRQAYKAGIERIWVLNVGDIKPSEYQIQLFFDLAWDIRLPDWQRHLADFLVHNIGEQGKTLLPLMETHYRLAFRCKPEFLAGTRVEESDAAWKVQRDLPWTVEDIRQRLADYKRLSDAVEQFVPRSDRETTYFHLVKYPVQAAAQMNRKHLTAQLARHGLADWAESDVAHDSIIALTAQYNTGKWQGFMDWQPRRLPVFQRVPHTSVSQPLDEVETASVKALISESSSIVRHERLGVSGEAVELKGDAEAVFSADGDSVTVEFRFLPTHPVSGTHLRLLCNGRTMDYATQGRSEEWKQNVLRNQAIRRIRLKNEGILYLHPIDPGIIIDEIRIYAR